MIIFLYSTSSTSYDILTSQNSDLGIEFAFFFEDFQCCIDRNNKGFWGVTLIWKQLIFFLYHFVGFLSLSNNNSQLYYIFFKDHSTRLKLFWSEDNLDCKSIWFLVKYMYEQ